MDEQLSSGPETPPAVGKLTFCPCFRLHSHPSWRAFFILHCPACAGSLLPAYIASIVTRCQADSHRICSAATGYQASHSTNRRARRPSHPRLVQAGPLLSAKIYVPTTEPNPVGITFSLRRPQTSFFFQLAASHRMLANHPWQRSMLNKLPFAEGHHRHPLSREVAVS